MHMRTNTRRYRHTHTRAAAYTHTHIAYTQKHGSTAELCVLQSNSEPTRAAMSTMHMLAMASSYASMHGTIHHKGCGGGAKRGTETTPARRPLVRITTIRPRQSSASKRRNNQNFYMARKTTADTRCTTALAEGACTRRHSVLTTSANPVIHSIYVVARSLTRKTCINRP